MTRHRTLARMVITQLRLHYSESRQDNWTSREDYYLLLCPPHAKELSIVRMER